MAGSEPESGCAGSPLRVCRLGPIVVLAAAAAMLVWSWRSWPDPLIDYGQQLYVSWRLVEGDALYRDVAYLYGPLSPWVNALFFRLGGVGLITLVAGNLVILGGLILLLWRLLVGVGSCCAATVAGITFVTVFAFGQLVEFGNYNFVCPYSYGVTHGVALTLLALYLLALYQRRPRTIVVAGLGLASGCYF